EEAASPKPEEDIKETPDGSGPLPVLDEALPEEQEIEFEEIEKAIEASMPETGAKEVETGSGRALAAAEEVELKEGPEETKEDAPLIEFEEPKLEFREEAQAEEKEEPFIEPPKELEILEGISEAPKEEAAAEAPEVEISMEVEPSEDVPAEVLIEEAPVIEVDAQEEEMVISESPAPEADSEIIEVEGIQVESLPEADDELREDDLSSAFSELMAKMEPPEENSDISEEQALSDEKTDELETKEDENIFPEVAFVESDQPRIEDTPFEKAREGDYVDLSAELGMEEALEDLAGSWGGGGAETKDTFDEFKKGIGKQLIKEDSETHYNLGIAYMEMELYNEAAKEFKIAMKEPRLEFDCYIRLGLCAMADDNPGEAIIYYLKGLKIEGKSNEERKGMFYELALAYEAAGEKDEAFQLFKTIYDMEPGYREVAVKIKEWASERPLIPLDDGLIEVELL
ncbi:MAG: hypothetical protein HY954_07615, partial [Deltaproteobacteria bacterium]|nr:hypothetical protein [Deltaproteobacteria bacterium]